MASIRRLVDIGLDLGFEASLQGLDWVRAGVGERGREKGFSQFRVRWPEEYQWEPAHKWVDHLLRGFREMAEVELAAVAQEGDGVLVFELLHEGTSYPIAIDYADKMDLNEAAVQKSFLYFKMQYARAGYPHEHVLPGGFIPADKALYSYLAYLRRIHDSGEFRYDVFARFGMEFAQGVRLDAINRLNEQQSFRFEGGAARIRYSRYLRQMARSKICIDLPGNGDFCFRLIDYLAVGTCVIAYPHRCRLQPDLEDRINIVYMKEDLSDLVELCEYYLENEGEREKIALAGRHYFEEHLHYRCLSRYYLKSIAERSPS